MTQEVEVVLTLEVDATKSKKDIADFINDMEQTYTRHASQKNRMEVPLFKIKSIKEEAELYGNE